MIGLGYSKRGPLGEIKRLFPEVIISEGITEEDELWAKTGGNESDEEAGKRVESAFKEVWDMANDDDRPSSSHTSHTTLRKADERYRHRIPQRNIQYPLA